jgi:hypothetical protein
LRKGKKHIENLPEWKKPGHQQWLADRMVIDKLGGLSKNAEAIGETGINAVQCDCTRRKGSTQSPLSRGRIVPS